MLSRESSDKKISDLYLARSEGKIIQFQDISGEWYNVRVEQTLYDFHRIKPQTVDEAAEEFASTYTMLTAKEDALARKGFKFGVKFQKEQGNS